MDDHYTFQQPGDVGQLLRQDQLRHRQLTAAVEREGKNHALARDPAVARLSMAPADLGK
jgi:hypothetical protein